MVFVFFVASLVITGAVLSIVPVEGSSTHHNGDYHLVPFAGDSFGA